MPLCQGCGASYDDTYKFCPHCGRAKPEPQSFQSWAEVVFRERKRAWDATNYYLIQEGWSGLTDKAVHRKVPSCLEEASHYSREPSLSHVAYLLEVWLPPNPPVGTTKDLEDYRYRRVAG
jgi:hypothetical protein